MCCCVLGNLNKTESSKMKPGPLQIFFLKNLFDLAVFCFNLSPSPPLYLISYLVLSKKNNRYLGMPYKLLVSSHYCPSFVSSIYSYRNLQPVIPLKSKYFIHEGSRLRIQQLRIRTGTTIILKAMCNFLKIFSFSCLYLGIL